MVKRAEEAARLGLFGGLALATTLLIPLLFSLLDGWNNFDTFILVEGGLFLGIPAIVALASALVTPHHPLLGGALLFMTGIPGIIYSLLALMGARGKAPVFWDKAYFYLIMVLVSSLALIIAAGLALMACQFRPPEQRKPLIHHKS